MSDLFGPAQGTTSGLNTLALLARPGDDRTSGAADTWFGDCSSEQAADGTAVRSAWLNGMLALLRVVARGNGMLADGVTPVLADANVDAQVLTAVQHLIQRGRANVAFDAGAQNAMVAPLTPVPPELPDGFAFSILPSASNNGPTTVRVGPATYHVQASGAELVGGEITRALWTELRFNKTAGVFQLMAPSPVSKVTLPGAEEGVVFSAADNKFLLGFQGLAALSTLNAADLLAVYQSEDEGGEPGGHHRSITVGELIAFLTPTAAGGAPTIRVFTSSQTYVPTAGRTRGIAFGTGGGGAGGSAGPAATGSTWGSGNSDPLTSTGTGGSGGSTFVKALDLTTLGAGVAITIGGGGAPTPESAAVSAGAIIVSQGGSGGTTSLGALANAPGGPGGYNNFGAYAAYAPQATGGVGDVVIPGQGGGPVTSILSAAVIAGNGGGTLLSPTGGRAGSLYGSAAGAGMTSAPGFSLDTAADAAIAHNGEDGPGWGTGGGGAVGLASGGLGGNGAPGVLIVIEF